MKKPRQLTNKDFPNKSFLNDKIPPTMDNFDLLLNEHNKLVAVVNKMIENEFGVKL